MYGCCRKNLESSLWYLKKSDASEQLLLIFLFSYRHIFLFLISNPVNLATILFWKFILRYEFKALMKRCILFVSKQSIRFHFVAFFSVFSVCECVCVSKAFAKYGGLDEWLSIPYCSRLIYIILKKKKSVNCTSTVKSSELSWALAPCSLYSIFSSTAYYPWIKYSLSLLNVNLHRWTWKLSSVITVSEIWEISGILNCLELSTTYIVINWALKKVWIDIYWKW